MEWACSRSDASAMNLLAKIRSCLKIAHSPGGQSRQNSVSNVYLGTIRQLNFIPQKDEKVTSNEVHI